MYRKMLLALVLSLLLPNCLVHGIILIDSRLVMRGDANNSHAVDLADVMFINAYLFNGGPAPPCLNQADANNDGAVDNSDSVYLLSWLYQGGPAPPAPGPFNTTCAQDNTPYPGCAQDPCN